MTSPDAKQVNAFVPLARMGEFTRKIGIMQAAAIRLNMPLWEVVIGDKEWRPVKVAGNEIFDGVDALGHPLTRVMQLEGHPVSIFGYAPVLEGWQFLAKIEHEEGGNLVKQMTGGDASPVGWHTCGPNCSHCDLSRQRKSTYMLSNDETGEVKQVGSTCVSDFLGDQSRDPERIASMYDYLMDLEREFEYDPDREMDSAGRVDYGVPPSVLMASVLKIVQEDGGYISSEKGDDQSVLSTGDRLRAAFWSTNPIAVVPDAEQIAKASGVVDWLKEQKGANSLWLRNIGYLADRTCVTNKDAGLFASGYVAWNRDLERQLKSERGSGDWVGSRGDKVSILATLERHAGFDTQFGYKTVLSFRDELGNGLTWKTQSPPEGLVVGSTYRVLATVKEHGEYKGEKQTEITRAKLAELELFSFGPLPGFKKLAAVATPDVVDGSGHSPLLKAVWGDHVDHAKALLLAGADANQLNQGKIPILGYANSPLMAQALLDAGARADDISPADLDHMEAGPRDVVLASQSVFSSLEPQVVVDVVNEGSFSGPVLSISDGVAVQKVGRGDVTARHDVSKLSATVKVGDMLDIRYKGGVGVIGGMEAASKDVGL